MTEVAARYVDEQDVFVAPDDRELPADIVVATRYYGWHRDTGPLRRFLEDARDEGFNTILAVDGAEDRGHAAEFLGDDAFADTTTMIEVAPWGFSTALNALTGRAMADGYDALHIASIEFPPTSGHVTELARYLTGSVVCVGAVVDGHDHDPGKTIHAANALQVPWNTDALWRVGRMGMLAIPPIVDMPQKPQLGGMEEVVTLAMHQRLFGSEAVLLRTSDQRSWDRSGWDQEKLAAHERKISSKIARSRAQMSAVNEMLPLHRRLAYPTVRHEISDQR